MNKKYPASYTIALYDALNFDNTLLDILDSDKLFKDNNLKDRFISYWGIYEISGETLEMFRVFINRKYNELSNKYLQRLELWINKLNYLQPIVNKIIKDLTITDKGSLTKTYNSGVNRTGTDTNIDYELPNKNATSEYPTSKQVFNPNTTSRKSGNDIDNKEYTNKEIGSITENKGYNIVEQTEKYDRVIKDIIQEFIYEFRDCFLSIM